MQNAKGKMYKWSRPLLLLSPITLFEVSFFRFHARSKYSHELIALVEHRGNKPILHIGFLVDNLQANLCLTQFFKAYAHL